VITLTPDIAALCAALDDGDDSALPILADALEEADPVEAAGILWPEGFFRRRRVPALAADRRAVMSLAVRRFTAGLRLIRGHSPGDSPAGYFWGDEPAEVYYRCRSAAMLAVAEALAEALAKE
jgi:hypothetical protein